jgi:hypothetical protein
VFLWRELSFTVEKENDGGEDDAVRGLLPPSLATAADLAAMAVNATVDDFRPRFTAPQPKEEEEEESVEE